MIEINHNSYQKDNNDDNHDNHNRELERRLEREHRHRCEPEPERFEEGECGCRKKIEAPVVLSPIIAVTGGNTAIGAFPCRTAIQILNNTALLASYTIVLQSLPKCETGFVVIETESGITSISLIGANNVSTSALTSAGSYIVLKWIGETWTQV